MKTRLFILVLAGMLCGALPGTARSGLYAGLEIQDESARSFYFAVGDYYGVPEKQVVMVHQRNISDDEMPVVFFLAARAHVGPDVIVGLRIGGSSWAQICAKYNIGADVFYVPVSANPGPPYGKAYGHYKNKDKSHWKEIQLTNADIVNFVNLKFVSEHQRCSPDDVIKARGAGQSFVSISHDIEQKRTRSSVEPDNGKGKAGKSGNSGNKGTSGNK